uniref:Homeobox domain-containing protein n=1 Tax=Chaetoceros debilis TaxID=122233 RepID=A0A7S3PTW3_9STRA|mmetsp:Transcript_4943/g.7270  ORF Transcript_4943/g.7270 Transcript_4943/m.7270 type:complete len:695 (+) Transcript_4943:304-2388(+)
MAFEDLLVAPPPIHINTVSHSALDGSLPDSYFTSATPTTDILDTAVVSDNQLQEASPSRRNKRSVKKPKKAMADVQDSLQQGSDDDEVGTGSGTTKPKGTKSRRELPAGAVATLKAWLLSPEHFTHPYPTPQDQVMLMQKTGIDKKQLKNWFTNARRRIWKPMLKKQLEQGKISQTGSGGVVTMPGAPAAPGIISAPPQGSDYSNVNPAANQMVDHSQSMQQNYQQALVQQQPQQPSQQQSYDQYGNPTFVQHQQNQPYANNPPNFYQQGQYNQQQNDSMPQSSSIGSLPPMPGVTPPGSSTNMNKTDSHAVLMELFARDQDLVRQATKAHHGDQSQQVNQDTIQNGHVHSQLGSQHPMSTKIAGGSSTVNKLGNVPSMNSWPHFSSVSSLNNLGTMTGVKSITNMSGADLVSQGSMNKKGNLAQVKSIENMGRADSYAFLEVFFDNTNPGSSMQSQRGIKREREEDDNVGLSLDGDDATSPAAPSAPVQTTVQSSAPVPAPLPPDGKDKEGLKRAYDDALAARGLISVSRSSEKLTDLALPAKMQRTISQDFLRKLQGRSTPSTTFTSFSFNSPNPVAEAPAMNNINNMPPALQHPAIQQPGIQFNAPQHCFDATNMINGNQNRVTVPATTKCALCNDIHVDTQLRPCGCMFHGRCLKPSIQNAVGAPQCPIDKITMLSAVLAVPREEGADKP